MGVPFRKRTVPLYESRAFRIPLVSGILESGTACERNPGAGDSEIVNGSWKLRSPDNFEQGVVPTFC